MSRSFRCQSTRPEMAASHSLGYHRVFHIASSAGPTRLSIPATDLDTQTRFEMLELPGQSALSDFRQKSLLRALQRQDERVRVVGRPRSEPFTAMLNQGWRACVGELIARMDADDFAHRDRLQMQVQLLASNPDLDACGTLVHIRKRRPGDARREHRVGATSASACPCPSTRLPSSARRASR